MTKTEIINVFKTESKSREKRYSDDTVNTYLQYITKYLDFLGNKELCDTTERDCRRFLATYDGKADKTYNTVVTSLKALYDILDYSYMVDEDYIKENPMKRINVIAQPKCKEKKAITVEDYYKLLSACKNSRDKAIITMFMNTCIRENELLSITLEQYENRIDNCIRLVITKGSKERDIYLNDDVVNAIDLYLKDRKEGSDTLFVSNQGNKMCHSCIWRTIRNIAKRANLDEDVIDGLSAHTFRHSGITNMANNGVSLQTIATIVGHSSIDMTMKYVDRERMTIRNAMMQTV